MTNIAGRRKTLFGTEGMKMLDISGRSNQPRHQGPCVPSGDDMLPLIEQYTEGDFYLSNFSIGFRNEHDLLMFKLAFNR